MYQNHQSRERGQLSFNQASKNRTEGAYVKILVHLVDELVLGIGERAHQVATTQLVKYNTIQGHDNLRVGLAVSALGRRPGPGTCPGCEESAAVLRRSV
jgi:hypothetical protein